MRLNGRVAIITGAVGAGTFGIMSTYLMIQNGQMVGALSHDMSGVGKLGFRKACSRPSLPVDALDVLSRLADREHTLMDPMKRLHHRFDVGRLP